MRFKVSLEEMFVYKMAAAANQITQVTAQRAREAVRDLAIMSESKAREYTSQRLHSTRQKYDDNLFFRQTGDWVWTLTLDADAAYLEEGYGAFDMISHGLASKMPPEGSARIAKDGSTYIRVPFEQTPAIASPSHPLHDVPVQRGQAMETTKGNLASDLMQLRRLFGDRGTTATATGVPVQGKVYTIRKSDEGPRWNYQDVLGNQRSMLLGGPEDRPISPLLSGLTKIQTKIGKRVRTQYMTWRTASSKMAGSGKWVHPGFQGAHIFPDLERWAVDTLTRNLHEIFQQGKP